MVPRPIAVSQRRAFEGFPVCLGGEGIEVLVRASVQSYIRGPDDPAEIGERFFIDLVILEELRVVAKIAKEPVEFLESSFGAVQPPGEELGFEGFGLQYRKSDLHKGLLWMPAVASSIYANQK